jgi:hypothetical protein
MDLIPRPPKRFFSGPDEYRAFEKPALEHELHEESESGDDTVDEYGHCPTVILVESSSDISSESSDDGATVTYGPDGYKYIVFAAKKTSRSDEEIHQPMFGDTSDSDEVLDPSDSSNGGVKFFVPKLVKRCLCGKETGNSRVCTDCWKERKKRSGAPPKLKRRKKAYADTDSNDELRTEDACVVCMAEKKQMTLVHGQAGIGHRCVCLRCAERLNKKPLAKRICPVCRKQFTNVKLSRTTKEYKRYMFEKIRNADL